MTDVQQLSTFLEVGADVIESQQLAALLPSLLAKAHEYTQLKSRTLVLEVEVEQANRQGELRAAAIQKQLDATVAEFEQSKTSGSSLATNERQSGLELDSLKSQTADLHEQVHTLTSRNTILAEEKRQALNLVDRQSQMNSRHEEDYASLSERYRAFRESSAALETEVSNARTLSSSLQFKLTSVETEVGVLQKNVEYLTSELAAKTADFSNYRKETSTTIMSLQQECDVAKSQATSLEISINAHRSRNDELTTSLEQALNKAHDLEQQCFVKEETFRNEMVTQSRLTELHERSARDAKQRVSQLEEALDRRNSNDNAENVKAIQDHDAAEHRCQELERHVAFLEADIERLGNELNLANDRINSSAELASDGVALLSPSAHILNRIQKSGLNLTQLYSELLKTKQDLEHEKRKNSKLQHSFDDLIRELEARAPQLQEQREEYSQLQVELSSMSENLEFMTRESETMKKQLQSAQSLSKEQSSEIHLYQQQVVDLSRQIQKLLFEIEEEGFRAAPLSEAEITALNRMLEVHPNSDSAVDGLISERLVLFKNIQELQAQNAQQLRVTRQLGSKMEREEEEHRVKFRDLESSALSDANNVIETLNAELVALRTKSDALAHERDMFRKMLLQSKNQETAVNIPEQSVNTIFRSTDELTDLRTQYEAYKTETNIDQNIMKDQLAALTKERGDLSLQVGRATSQVQLAEERHKILNGALDMMRKEVEESRKRSLTLQETMSKQDYRTQQIAEELIDNKSLLESLRGENSNYKAEKQLWKSIESRMSSELESVREERNRLNGLVANLQAIQSERERSDVETSKRYNEQIESLQNELENTMKRLSEERDEVRRMTMNKDHLSRETQEKIESLLKQAADAREAHAVANTEKEGYRTQMQSFQTKLNTAEGRLSIFSKISAEQGDEERITTEQRLQLQVVELQAALEKGKQDMRQIKDHATKMENIANSSEEAIQNMNTSHEELVEIMTRREAEQLKTVKDLELRVQDLLSELSTSNQELTILRTNDSGKCSALQREIDNLGAQIVGLQEVEEKYAMAQAYYQEDLRSQAEIAQEAQQNYENELMKHAEAAQSLRTLRQDYNEIRNELLNLRREADSAESRLLSESRGWENQKALYERELSELHSRMTDLQHQNELLHNQFETFTRQMNQRAQDHATDISQDNSDNVNEIIRYLRREKEIVDVSYEVLQQENKRVKQQLAHANSSLDESQTQLTVERQRAAQLSVSASQSSELMSKLDDLNLIRESNITLRAENQSNVNNARQLEIKVKSLQEKVEPLENQLRQVEAENNTKTQEIKMLQEDNERWKHRNQSILQKYERIDPAELQQLREKATNADQQLQDLETSMSDLRAQIEEKQKVEASLQEQVKAQIARFDTLMQQSRDRIKKERTEAKNAIATAKSSAQEVATLQNQISDLNTELATANSKTAEPAVLESLQAQIKGLELENAQKVTTLEERLTATSKELDEAKNAMNTLEQEREAALQATQTESAAATSATVLALENELARYRTEIEEVRATSDNKSADPDLKEELAQSKNTINELQAQIEELKNSTTQASAVDSGVEMLKEGEIQQRIDEALAKSATEEEIQSRIAEALSKHTASVTDEGEIQKRISEALAEQSSSNEAALQQRIDEAVSQAKVESSSGQSKQANEAEVVQKIEEVVKAKDEELKTRIRAITKERVDQIVEQRFPKKLEAERQNWLKEAEEEKLKAVAAKEDEMKAALQSLESTIADRLKAQAESVRKESEMRNTLKMNQKDKKVAQLEKKIAELSAPPIETETADNGEAEDEVGSSTEAVTGQVDKPAPSNGTHRGRGGKHTRGSRRGAHQGTKRSREEGHPDGEQPSKKTA